MSNKHILLSLQQELLSKELIIEENNIVIKKLQLEKNALFNENQKKENIIKELNYKIIELEQKDKMKDIEKNNKQNNVINNNDDLNEQLKIENINLKNKINEIEIENSKILLIINLY